MAMLLLAAPVLGAGPRVVSLNPCVDAILTRVADAGQILAISHYSQDPRASSISLDVARRFHATSGTAEEIVVLQPDLVLSGPHVAPATVLALQRMKIPIVKYPVAESVAQSLAQVRSIGAALAQAGRAERLAQQIEAAVARARPSDGETITALIWQSGGLVPGTGTLPDQLLQLAGYRNMSARYGLGSWDILPLEHLLDAPPQLLLSSGRNHAREDRLLGHPAVRRLSASMTFRSYPFRLLSCAGPTIIEAISRLAEIRRELLQ